MSTPVTFAIVGSGWRSEFFLRLARTAADRLRAVGVMTRTDAATRRIREEWDVPTVSSLAEVQTLQPDFVIAAVSWPSMPGVVRELVDLGANVLAETPPAPDAAGLRQLWEAVGETGRVQVAEQYLLMPGHAARLELVRCGVIGTPLGVQVASTHLYHATSMIRGLLDVGMADATVTARTFTAPQLNPLSPDGWQDDPQPEPLTTTIATLDFGDGRMGLYDFVENQWWNPLLSRRILIRGSHGEISGDTVTRWTPDGPVTSHLSYRRAGVDLNLEGNELLSIAFDGEVIHRNAWTGTRFSEDDIAVAELLERTGRWARGAAAAPYSLADGCQDHVLGLAIEESAATGRDVRVAAEPWT